MALTKATYAMIQGEVVNVFDYFTATQIADVQAGTLLVDVTTPIQQAFAACEGSGKTLYFPEGKYSCSDIGVVNSGNITVCGAGYWRTILVNNKTDGRHFFYVQKDNVEIRDLQIDGNFAAQVTNTGTALIIAANPTIAKIQNITVQNCIVKSNGFDAIGLFNALRSTVQNNIVYNYYDTGIDVVDGTTELVIQGNSVISTGRYGIAIETGAPLTYNDNYNVIVDGNTISVLAGDDVRDGILLGNNINNIAVTNNSISVEATGVTAIRGVFKGEHLAISGNTLRGNGDGALTGIGIHLENSEDYASKNTNVTNNVITLLDSAIEVYKISGVTVVGNVCTATSDCFSANGDTESIDVTVCSNVFNGQVSFSGYSSTSTAYVANNIGDFTLVLNTAWTLHWIGYRPTITYSDGIIYYIDPVAKLGTTANRPATNIQAGDMYFDTTLTRPIWYTGSGWIKADGTSV